MWSGLICQSSFLCSLSCIYVFWWSNQSSLFSSWPRPLYEPKVSVYDLLTDQCFVVPVVNYIFWYWYGYWFNNRNSWTLVNLVLYRLTVGGSSLRLSESDKNMKLIFLAFLNILTGFPISGIPDKLRLYQNVTSIDDSALMEIYEKTLQGEFFLNIFETKNSKTIRWIWQHFSEISLRRNSRKWHC